MTTEEAEAFQHVLDNVLMLKEEDCIRKCLELDGNETLNNLLSLSNNDIADLKWKQDDGTVTPIRKHSKGRVMTFKRMAKFIFVNRYDITKLWNQFTNE